MAQGVTFLSTAHVSSAHPSKVIPEGFSSENELSIRTNYMALLFDR